MIIVTVGLACQVELPVAGGYACIHIYTSLLYTLHPTTKVAILRPVSSCCFIMKVLYNHALTAAIIQASLLTVV